MCLCRHSSQSTYQFCSQQAAHSLFSCGRSIYVALKEEKAPPCWNFRISSDSLLFLFCPTYDSCLPKEDCLVGKGRIPGPLTAWLQVGTTYLLYAEPLVGFPSSTLTSCALRCPLQWSETQLVFQEKRPVLRVKIFTGTILHSRCPRSCPFHPCPAISFLSISSGCLLPVLVYLGSYQHSVLVPFSAITYSFPY